MAGQPLKVFITSAAGLRDADWMPGGGKSDPYCICECPSKEVRFETSTVNDTADPVWNMEQTIESFAEGDVLQFTVYDRDPIAGDDVLGKVTVTSEQILNNGSFEGDLPLEEAGNASATLKLKLVVDKAAADAEAAEDWAAALSGEVEPTPDAAAPAAEETIPPDTEEPAAAAEAAPPGEAPSSETPAEAPLSSEPPAEAPPAEAPAAEAPAEAAPVEAPVTEEPATGNPPAAEEPPVVTNEVAADAAAEAPSAAEPPAPTNEVAAAEAPAPPEETEGGMDNIAAEAEQLLAEGNTYEEPAPASPPAAAAAAAPNSPGPSSPQAAGAEGYMDNTQDDWGEGAGTPSSKQKKTPKSMSTPALGSYDDLKRKTDFASTTTDGVLKRATFMSSTSNCRSQPKFSFGEKLPSAFIKGGTNPAPGTYNLPNDEKSRFKSVPKYSFGGSSRFGLAQSPAKKSPGPGVYTPFDPTLHTETKVGFGTGMRSKLALQAQAAPGPGAYEARSAMGQGLMFTARGRMQGSQSRSKSQPGPGAYTPATHTVHSSAPKCGFGTSTRQDIAGAARSVFSPGPGTYEMQNFASTGSDAPKYSATSRRRLHDLNSYVTPGPGSYNAHTTSFGY